MSAKSAAAVPTVEAIVTLAASYDLAIDPSSVSINEAGLDYRVAFANARDGQAWVLRMPRRPDVSAKLEEEARILEFVAPRLSVAVPQWAVYNEQLIAYPRLPGKPGLTLDEERQPVWHFDPTSPEYAVSLGTLVAALHADFTYQYMMAGPSFELTVRAYVEAGGAAHPKLPERCAEATAEK